MTNLAFLLCVAMLPATPGSGSVGVIGAGADPASAAALQSALESKLGALAIRSSDLASRIGTDDPIPSDAAARAEIRALLDDAAKAYYDDRYQVLLASLNKAELKPRSVAERIEIHLWRAAVLVPLNDPKGARDEARAALVLSPELVVDLSLYPLVVREIVDEVRPSITRVSVHVTGLPPSAVLTVDEREVSASSFLVAPGPHILAASAKGFRRVSRSFEIAAAAPKTSLEVRLPIALEPAFAKDLANSVREGDVPRSLDAVAVKAGAEVLVLALAEPDGVRAVVWWREDGRRSASERREGDSAGIAALADWVSAELSAGRPSERDVAWRMVADAGLATEVRARNVSGRYGAAFTGSGPRGQLSFARGSWIATFSGEAISFAASRVDVEYPGGGGVAGNGGTLFGARVGFAYTRRLGTPGEGQRAEAHAGLGASWERHAPKDVGGPTGELGLFPGHEWIATELNLGGSVRLSQSPRGALSAGLDATISPFGMWTEDPAGTTGRDPDPFGVSASAGLSWKTPRRWRVGAGYRFGLRTVSFSGPARAPVTPAISNARMTEQVHTATVTLGRDL